MPRHRGPSTRIAKGIYREATGYRVIVKVGTGARAVQREKRYPLGAHLRTMKAWQLAERARLLKANPLVARESLTRAIELYKPQVAHLASSVSLASELHAWRALYGEKKRALITGEDVRRARANWLERGVQPKTINNRVATLARLYRVLDGKSAPTPCDDVEPLAVHRTPPVVVDPALVRRVDAQLEAHERRGWLRNAKTRARFRVLMATGKRPSELMRAQPEDVDLERRVWIVRDGKGGFSPGVYLNDDMVAAFRLFLFAQAWGPFNQGSWVRRLHRAGWPIDLRPYQARHTVGILMSEAGVDLADVQAHMGHKRISTTRQNYVPVLGSRLEKASRLLDGRFGWLAPQAGTDRKGA